MNSSSHGSNSSSSGGGGGGRWQAKATAAAPTPVVQQIYVATPDPSTPLQNSDWVAQMHTLLCLNDAATVFQPTAAALTAACTRRLLHHYGASVRRTRRSTS
jgi:hypothetical protein